MEFFSYEPLGDVGLRIGEKNLYSVVYVRLVT